jgi:hypothetical protein
MTTEERIRSQCNKIAEMLVAKNRSYGDSALHPMAVFGPGDPIVSLGVRIDDKLSRIKNAPGAFGEDSLQDLIGYLVLLRLALEDKAKT